MSRYSVALIALFLAGCGQKVVKPVVPEIVHVPVTEYVPLPDELTKPCPAVHAKSRTVEAVVSAYNTNITTQEDCDKRMSQIRELQKDASSKDGK